MYMKLLLSIAILIVFVYLLSTVFKNKTNHCKQDIEEKKSDNLSLSKVAEQINQLNQLKEELYSIEKMITEIEICQPDERSTAVNISMPTNESTITIMANNTSDEILVLLQKERLKLRSSLSCEIKNLQYRCNDNCNDNYKSLNGEVG